MAATSIDQGITARREEPERALQPCGIYACPSCKRELQPGREELHCAVCTATYPVRGGIPDFILEKLDQSGNFSLRLIGRRDSSILLDFAAYIYESCIYPPVCNIYGGWRSTSLKKLAREVSAIVGSTNGVILDVACGPGTYGRRIASTSRTVYGVDACMSFLRRGAHYVERDRIPNVHFARATVEALPFRAGLFDAAICAGSLNHFSDTVLALREINRTMKAGAPLVVMCFFVGTRGLIRRRSLRDRAEKQGGHIFELSQLDRYLAEAGFEAFHPRAHGSILVFSARKKPAQH